MTLYQAELKYYLRSPVVWLILVLSSFISAWSFLISIEYFTVLQVKFAGMSDAPTITQGIVFPLVNAQSKLLILIASIIAGLSFSRLTQNNSWSVISNSQLSDWKIVQQKYLAILAIVLIFLLPALAAVISLMVLTEIQGLPILVALIGLLLLLMWMLALGLLISSTINNTGFAILMCVVVFVVLWLLAQSTLDTQWGVNWIQVFSPFYHFKQFSSDYISLASVVYFISGTASSLWAIKIRLVHKRYSL